MRGTELTCGGICRAPTKEQRKSRSKPQRGESGSEAAALQKKSRLEAGGTKRRYKRKVPAKSRGAVFYRKKSTTPIILLSRPQSVWVLGN
jgi:hypothetical protein